MEQIVGLTEWANTPTDLKVGSIRGWGGRGQLIRRDPATGRAEIVPVRIVADCDVQRARAEAEALALPAAAQPLALAMVERIQELAAPAGRYDCPTCHRADVLSRYEAAHGYQCRECTRRAEGYGFES